MAFTFFTLASAFMAATSYASPLKTLAARQPDVGGFAYTGCYTEATSQRALSGNSFFDDAMTLEKCAAACSGFPHFGVEYGRECYCGSTLNTGSVSTSEDECNFACSGNAAEKCGAGNRLNVYSKTVTTPTTCTASYGLMGCYSEGTNQRALVGKMIGNDSMTIDMCAASCSGYKYFGLEYYRECYCGDEFSDGSVELAATDCTFPCMGDQTEVCGGGSKLSIYSFDSISNPSSASSTSTSAPTSTPSSASLYVANGCRTEGTNGRALASASYFDDAMTVEKCEAICEGYTYFGLEYGRECYCGNLFGTGSVATLASECSMTCPGNRAQMCGAGDRLSLYVLKSSLPVSSSTSLSSLISSSSTLSSISSTSTSVSSSTSASSSALSSSSLSSVSTSSTTTTTSSSTSQAISSSSTQVTPSSTSSSSIQTTSTSFSSVSSTTSSSVSSTFTSITSSLSSTKSSSSTSSTSTTSSTTSSAPVCTATSPLLNTGFETITGTVTPTSWIWQAGAGGTTLQSITSSVTSPHSGSRSYRIHSPVLNGNNIVYTVQNIVLCPGSKYSFSGWYKMANANSGITVQFGVGSPLVLITTAQTTGTEWTQISGTFVAAGAASTKFYVFTTFPATPAQDMYWDDIVLTLV